ncbi:MAG: M15 family metallopeptidase, partial [Dehalococcoidia bacterium]
RSGPPSPKRGRRELLRLAALGLGGVAVACGRGDDSETQTGQTEPRPTGAKPRASATPAAEQPAAVAGEQQCLVTKKQALSPDYVPNDLTLLPERLIANNGVQLRQQAADAVVKLVDAAQGEDFTLFVLSGFRSYQEQEKILDQEVQLYGKQTAEKQVAPPGHSEHQLGLAADITCDRAPYELAEDFGNWPEGLWLAAGAAKFGFVVSYPRGKEPITGYIYEPWHIRYVGLPLAEEVAASGLTLTEFLPKNNLVAPCP